MATIWVAAFQLHRVGDEFHVGVTERQECIEVTSVEGIKRSPDEFDVLLRHRPPSIPLLLVVQSTRPDAGP